MLIANCEVRLGGDPLNSVYKKDMTIAEIALLRMIHGLDAVIRIQEVRNDRRPERDELRRLRQIYGKYPEPAEHLQTLWSEYGGGFPKDWSDLELSEAFFDKETVIDQKMGAEAKEQDKRKLARELGDPMTQEQDDFKSKKIKATEE